MCVHVCTVYMHDACVCLYFVCTHMCTCVTVCMHDVCVVVHVCACVHCVCIRCVCMYIYVCICMFTLHFLFSCLMALDRLQLIHAAWILKCLACGYKYNDDLMSVVFFPSDNGTSNRFEVSLEFLWSHRCFSQRLFAVLPGTSVLGPCISFVSSRHCQCHAWRCLEGEGHSVFKDWENAVGRHLAKLFFWFSWNLPPCSVEHKSWYADATHIQLLYSSAYDKVFNRLGPTHPDLQASSGMALSLSVHLNNTVWQMRTVCKPTDLKQDDNWMSIAHRFSILFGKS